MSFDEVTERSNSTNAVDKLFGKANRLLGLDENVPTEMPRPSTLFRNQSSVNTATSSFMNMLNPNTIPAGVGKVSIQRAGWLYKKPFYATNLLSKRAPWAKRFFVLKDSFLFWYRNPPKLPKTSTNTNTTTTTTNSSNANFCLYPDGVLPLGGCTVHQEGKEKNYFLFEVTHPQFNGRSLLLKSSDENDARDWISILTECRDATYDNAMLGDAQTAFLAAKGSEAESLTQHLLETATEKAEQAQKEIIERQKLMEQQMRQKREFREQVKEQKEKVKEKDKELEKVKNQLEEKKGRSEEEEAEMRVLEEKLNEAKLAVEKLQLAVLEKKSDGKQKLLQDINELRNFLNLENIM